MSNICLEQAIASAESSNEESSSLLLPAPSSSSASPSSLLPIPRKQHAKVVTTGWRRGRPTSSMAARSYASSIFKPPAPSITKSSGDILAWSRSTLKQSNRDGRGDNHTTAIRTARVSSHSMPNVFNNSYNDQDELQRQRNKHVGGIKTLENNKRNDATILIYRPRMSSLSLLNFDMNDIDEKDPLQQRQNNTLNFGNDDESVASLATTMTTVSGSNNSIYGSQFCMEPKETHVSENAGVITHEEYCQDHDLASDKAKDINPLVNVVTWDNESSSVCSLNQEPSRLAAQEDTVLYEFDAVTDKKALTILAAKDTNGIAKNSELISDDFNNVSDKVSRTFFASKKHNELCFCSLLDETPISVAEHVTDKESSNVSDESQSTDNMLENDSCSNDHDTVEEGTNASSLVVYKHTVDYNYHDIAKAIKVKTTDSAQSESASSSKDYCHVSPCDSIDCLKTSVAVNDCVSFSDRNIAEHTRSTDIDKPTFTVDKKCPVEKMSFNSHPYDTLCFTVAATHQNHHPIMVPSFPRGVMNIGWHDNNSRNVQSHNSLPNCPVPLF